MAGKTLIVYASKSGANAWTAEVIAKTLRTAYNMDVAVEDLKKGEPDISPYQNIIIGSGVRAGRVYKEAVEFLAKDFGDRKVALYFGCGSGGDPKQHDKAVVEYSEKALNKNKSLRPTDVAAFGGCMKVLGKVVYDARDANKVQEWATELGKKL